MQSTFTSYNRHFLPDHLVSRLGHDDAGGDARAAPVARACAVGADGQLGELGLLHADVPLAAEDAAAAEVLGPTKGQGWDV